MSSLKDLLQQREQLNAQIEQARQSELSEALAKVHAVIQEYGLNTAGYFPFQRPPLFPRRWFQSAAQIPRSRHGRYVDGPWQTAEVD